MNLKRAALNMIRPVKNSGLPDIDPQCGKDHMLYMIEQIASGEVTEEKAHRWLGYIQGCVVSHDGATLEEVKNINKLC